MIDSVVVLAGGLATRVRPLTEKIPKSMIDINGTPFVDYQLRLLASQGIKNVVLCTGYLGEQIEKHVGTGKQFGLRVQYSPDGEKLLGTAGTIKKALPLLPDTFFTLYGDSYLPISYKEVADRYESAGKPMVMSVIKNEDKWDKSNTLYESGMVIEYNKANPRPEMKFTEYGLNVMGKSCFDTVSEGQVADLADMFHTLSIQGDIAGFETTQRFYEIGSFGGIADFTEYITNQ